MLRQLLFALVATTPALAQAPAYPTPTDLDLGPAESRLGVSGFTTYDEVDALQKKLRTVMAAGDCTDALPVIREYAAKTNTLAVLMGAGLRPYFAADDPSLTGIGQAVVDKMSRQVAYQVKERNSAWVSEAKCLAETGDRTGAVVRYAHVLSFVTPEEPDTWRAAREGLWTLAGIPY